MRVFVIMLMMAGAAFFILWDENPVPNTNKEIIKLTDDEKKYAYFLSISRDMEVGSLITAKELKWRRAVDNDGDVELSGYFIKGAVDVDKIHGSVLRQELKSGDLLSRYDMAKPGESGYLSAIIRPDMRAVSIVINRVTGSSGLILPGNFVDVMLSSNKSGKKAKAFSGLLVKTILSGVRVLAVNDKVESLAQSKVNSPEFLSKENGTATLEVSSEQAQLLILASEVGELTLILRSVRSNRDDIDDTKVSYSNSISKEFPSINSPPSMVLMHGINRRDLSAPDAQSQNMGE